MTVDPELRAYDPDADREALWSLKRAFERELGGLGGEAKADTYEGKLTPAYRERYADWVERCVERDPGCVVVADLRGAGETDADAADTTGADSAGSPLAGYAFVLPDDLGLVWDAAVLNELYVREGVRGTGLADALLDRALEHARTQDPPLPRMVLDVAPDNRRARAFYEGHGFEPWGEMVAREL